MMTTTIDFGDSMEVIELDTPARIIVDFVTHTTETQTNDTLVIPIELS